MAIHKHVFHKLGAHPGEQRMDVCFCHGAPCIQALNVRSFHPEESRDKKQAICQIYEDAGFSIVTEPPIAATSRARSVATRANVLASRTFWATSGRRPRGPATRNFDLTRVLGWRSRTREKNEHGGARWRRTLTRPPLEAALICLSTVR